MFVSIGAAFAVALWSGVGQAAVASEYTADPILDSVDYTSALVTGHAHQRFALFRPAGAPPASGTPVVIVVNNSGLASTDPCYASAIRPEMLWIYSFLDAGFAVVRAALTSSSSSQSSIPTSGGPCVDYPDLSQHGNGLFHPPGFALPGLAVPPYSDHDKPMAEKDVVMLIQHVRHNAAAYGLDPDRIAITGRSGGAVIAMWAAVGPERGKELFPGGTGQDAESSRVDAGVFDSPPVYLPAFVPTQFVIPHFCKTASGPFWITPSDTLKTAPGPFLKEASPLFFAAEALHLNISQRFYFTYGEPPQSTNFTAPYITNTITAGHSSWFGYAWKTLYPQSRLVIHSRKGLVPGGPHDAFIRDVGVRAFDMIQYLREELELDPPVEHPYQDGTPAKHKGKLLTPLLTGSGEFSANDAPLLSLAYARPSARAFVVHSQSYSGSPLFGGTLGPGPAVGVIQRETGADGTLKMKIPPTAIPPGTSLHVQVWVQDPEGTNGFTASNTVRVDG